MRSIRRWLPGRLMFGLAAASALKLQLQAASRDGSLKGEGSGLGLAIVSRIAERHRVGLSLRNNEGRPGLCAAVFELLACEASWHRHKRVPTRCYNLVFPD